MCLLSAERTRPDNCPQAYPHGVVAVCVYVCQMGRESVDCVCMVLFASIMEIHNVVCLIRRMEVWCESRCHLDFGMCAGFGGQVRRKGVDVRVCVCLFVSYHVRI